MRVRCRTNRWHPSRCPDPELTTGRFYTVVDSNVSTMAGESLYTLVGDSGEEIQRPKYAFALMPEVQRLRIRRERVANKIRMAVAGVIRSRRN